jgi:2-polyprenyl-3-methyl-5-hydroxy-6-metoxy-1,4-benzoquinol methylase
MTLNCCKICGDFNVELLFRSEGKRYAPGEYFHLYRCENCSGVYIYPTMEFAELQRYYPSDYQPHDPNQPKSVHIRQFGMDSLRQFVYGCKPNSGARKVIYGRKFLSGIFDRLTYRSLPWPKCQGTLLDIGCGSGVYLATVKSLGWNGIGIESNLRAARYANRHLGLAVEAGDFEGAAFPEKHFDAITMWHSLEHFSDPKKIIRKVRLLLKDDGVLMIGLPNFSSLDQRFFRESWNGLEIPLHVCHFTPESIQYLLKECGFKSIKVVHTTRPTDMMKSLVNFFKDRYRYKSNRFLTAFLFLISMPISLCFSIIRRSSIIKVFAC